MMATTTSISSSVNARPRRRRPVTPGARHSEQRGGAWIGRRAVDSSRGAGSGYFQLRMLSLLAPTLARDSASATPSGPSDQTTALARSSNRLPAGVPGADRRPAAQPVEAEVAALLGHGLHPIERVAATTVEIEVEGDDDTDAPKDPAARRRVPPRVRVDRRPARRRRDAGSSCPGSHRGSSVSAG